MRPSIVAIALLGLASAAPAEQYQCTSDSGCTARITVDGVVETHEFRKGDIVDTGSGWDVSGSCCEAGWTKVKTTDDRTPKPPRPPAGATSTFVVDDRMAGTTLGYGSLFHRTYVGTQAFTGGSGAGSDDTYEMHWKHDADGNGSVYQPQTVVVKCEKRTGETTRAHADRFKQMVDAMRDLFPPNVPETP